MHDYLETHPWLTFRLNLQNSGWKLWILLGETQAKCEQIAGVPLLPNVATTLNQIFLAKGVFATTSIEGNSLSEEDVQKRLRGELELPPSKEYLGIEIDNVIKACNQIMADVFSGKITQLTAETIKQYNRTVLNNLRVGEDVVPGEIRQHRVMVGRYLGAPAQDCDYLLSRLCQWINDELAPPEEYKRYGIAFGVLKAIIAHLYIAWIHPFGDGNGRTARLIEVQILLSAGVPSTSAHLLSDHYNHTRSDYYYQLDQSSRSGGDILPFIEYALQGFVDGLDEQLELVRGQQLIVHWINYVHEQFRHKQHKTDLRRRRLVLDMLEAKEPLLVADVRYVTVRTAEAFIGKTDKTIQRDLNIAVEMGLLIENDKKYSVNLELMHAFLSPALK